LGAQWEAELRCWFQPKKIDILAYGNGKEAHKHFWSEAGLYLQSKLPPSQRVIIASHSVSSLKSIISFVEQYTGTPARFSTMLLFEASKGAKRTRNSMETAVKESGAVRAR
jgi:hypothetical protein